MDKQDKIELIYRALELCCESRDRLTRFHLGPEHWITEAAFEAEQKEKNAKS